tara:strand:+ start:291 stop:611 length:321 start_codon:yes stop_codon:yes gene_type:complete
MFPKGGMGGLLKQAQEMQKKMNKAKEEIEAYEIEGTCSQNLVKVKLSGTKELKSIKLAPEIINEDLDIIEDLILIAFNDAFKKVSEEVDSKMKKVTGGAGSFPGLI